MRGMLYFLEGTEILYENAAFGVGQHKKYSNDALLCKKARVGG